MKETRELLMPAASLILFVYIQYKYMVNYDFKRNDRNGILSIQNADFFFFECGRIPLCIAVACSYAFWHIVFI